MPVTAVTTVDELCEIIGAPLPVVENKIGGRITDEVRAFISFSPLFAVGTSGPQGSCDVSPRGDPAGSVLVLDDTTLVFADRPGNKLAQSHRNILANPYVGLLFLVPGVRATLRINGRATIVREAPFLDQLTVRGHRPPLATVVHAEEVYMHCGRALARASIWDPQTWPDPSGVPTMGQVIKGQVPAIPLAAHEVDRHLDHEVQHGQYRDLAEEIAAQLAGE